MATIIFGVTGFIGRAVQAALEKSSDSFIGFGRQLCIRSDEGGPRKKIEARTPADRRSMLSGFPLPKAVIFAAGPAVTTTSPEVLRSLHLGSLRDAFAILPEKWLDGLSFVYTSSGLVYGRRQSANPIKESEPPTPNTVYGEIKLECERLLAELGAQTGIRSVTARLFNVSGIGHASGIVVDVARQAIGIRSGARSDFHLRSNTSILDIIDVREAAEGLLQLAKVAGAPPLVNICSGRAITAIELVDAACEIIGRDVPVSFDDDRSPCEALIGSPELMTAATNWRARKPLAEIISDVMPGIIR
jgi:nucleoside-diphosphate-sugar epimerase